MTQVLDQYARHLTSNPKPQTVDLTLETKLSILALYVQRGFRGAKSIDEPEGLVGYLGAALLPIGKMNGTVTEIG